MMAQSARANGLWSVAQQLTSVAFGGLIAIVIARILPVEEFGVFSYATTMASFGIAVMTGGLASLAIREFHHDLDKSEVTLSAIFVVRELMAVGAYAVLVGLSLTSGSNQVFVATAIACSAVILRVLDAPELWFQARLAIRTPALIRIASASVFFAARIIVLLVEPSLIALILLFVAEQLVTSIAILVAYRISSQSRIVRRPDLSEARRLLVMAAPLAMSSLANQANLKAPVVVIQAMVGATAVGIYSAASRLSEIIYLVPVAYMNATFPALLSTRKANGQGSVAYRDVLQRAYNGAFWFGVAIIAGTLLFADPVIGLLFGPEYSGSAAVLKIQSLACPFVFMAAVLSKWIIAEGKLWASLIRHGLGAVVNIAASILLLPPLGAVGAAWASVLGYATASYLFTLAGRSMREPAIMMSLAPAAPLRALLRFLRRGQGD